MKTIAEITAAIREKESFGYKASTYTMIGDVLVRVSNHLPKTYNIHDNNEDVKNIFFVFAESDLSEKQVEDYLNDNLKSYNVDFIIIDDSFDFTANDIFKAINRAF